MHRNNQTGEKEPITQKGVKNRFDMYVKRVGECQTKLKDEDLPDKQKESLKKSLSNNEMWLDYWRKGLEMFKK
jgi:hypothetical protein